MKERTNQPNVVFVITDDQGYGDLGCTGNPLLRTPAIDRFYEQSARFTDYHVGPTCAPTRAGLMTGHYANSTGVWHTIGGRSLLREEEWTLASALRENGYRTGIFGKWHLGDAVPYRPQDRGFETTVIHGGGGISQTPDYWGNDYFDDTYIVNGEPKAFEGYCTDVFFSEAMKFIEQNKDAPFFCYLPTNAPHLPYNVDDRYADPYRGLAPENRARFYGMIANIDENFAKLRRKLQELSLEEQTILVFMTDNGTSAGATVDGDGHVLDGYNAGLRGLKGSPYDGGHRVPFFIRWPAGGIAEGQDHDEVAANVDVMPTILDLCGVSVPQGRTFHGRSLKPLLSGEERHWPGRAIVTDSQRLTEPVKWRQSAVVTRQWRLINGSELYDALKDRAQQEDVSARYPEVVERLREHYEQWWSLVSLQFDEPIPISLGRGDEEVVLTGHDWRNGDCSCAWNQGLIRQGVEANGHWEIRVERSGEYAFELRRWPREAGHAMSAGIEGDDIYWDKTGVAEQWRHYYTGGKALPLARARLQIGSDKPVAEQRIESGADAVYFRIQLQEGETTLQTWLTDEEGELAIGAYYVYVRKL
ncbi:arylsulfatase [Paenibacillus sp. 1P07SE]|uniref:arylsulfatase n=1 Tax=Paenibacillus sp. 1P07SE TaxID=3132209 RepID=UPI0039A5016A